MKKINLTNACLICIIACEKCISHCIEHGHKECLSLCRDCADICTLTARLQARDSKYAKQVAVLCAAICKECVEVCGKQAAHNDACRECVVACQECADACTD